MFAGQCTQTPEYLVEMNFERPLRIGGATRRANHFAPVDQSEFRSGSSQIDYRDHVMS